ncbi:MAG: hypothetical protein KF886_18780 [Candidatus Hydrogenedentes bacterium]|nr:hypothetical protein [Candidatus Hydrogenedentota bacterium]
MPATLAISEEFRTTAQQIVKAQPALESTLRRYAEELGVSLDHVVLGSLMAVAEEYRRATGNGAIPCLY